MKVTAVDGGIVANVPLYDGLDRGYYAAEGIDLNLVPLSDASTDRPAALIVRQDLIDSGRYKTAADLKGMPIAAVPGHGRAVTRPRRTRPKMNRNR